MKPKLFTKKLFISTIDALDKQYRLDSKNAESIGEVFETMGIAHYNNGAITGSLMAILQAEFPPIGSHCDIEYFMWELDFGRKWKPGMVTYKGKDIKMKTAADLWRDLTRRK